MAGASPQGGAVAVEAVVEAVDRKMTGSPEEFLKESPKSRRGKRRDHFQNWWRRQRELRKMRIDGGRRGIFNTNNKDYEKCL